MYVLQTLAELVDKRQAASKSVQFRSISHSNVEIVYQEECLQLSHSGNSFWFSRFLLSTLLQEILGFNHAVGFIVVLDNEISSQAIQTANQNIPNLAVVSSCNPAHFLDNVSRLIACGKPIFAILLDSLTSYNYHEHQEQYVQALEMLNKFIVTNGILLVFGTCDFFDNRVEEATRTLCKNLRNKAIRLKKNT